MFEDNWDLFYKQNKDLVDLYRNNADKNFIKLLTA